MTRKSSFFSPAFYNAIYFQQAAHMAVMPGERFPVSSIEISIPEDGNFHFKVLANVIPSTIMPVTVPLWSLQTQWKYQSNKLYL